MTKKQKVMPAVQEISYIVGMLPGSSMGTPLRFALPENLREASVKEVIAYGLNLNWTRNDKDLAAAISREINGKYGITANGKGIDGRSKVYPVFEFREEPRTGTKYYGVDIVVGADQIQGLGIEQRL